METFTILIIEEWTFKDSKQHKPKKANTKQQKNAATYAYKVFSSTIYK